MDIFSELVKWERLEMKDEQRNLISQNNPLMITI